MMQAWKDKVCGRFDRAAAHYGYHNQVQRQVAERLTALLPARPAHSILEIGCGDGALTRLLMQKFPDSQITATDISPAMVKQAQAALGSSSRVEWAVMDGEYIDPPQTYDLIISNMTAQWFEDLDAALQRWQQSLKQGGAIYLSRPGPDNFRQWAEALAALDYKNGMPRHPRSPHIIREEMLDMNYPDTLSFLRAMRRAGVTTAHKNHTPLSPVQLKRACQYCDQQFGGTVSWHILYESITT